MHIKVEEAVGMVLAHDLTKIIPGTYKGAAYKKGYIIKKEDVELLKNIGKYHINIIKLSNEELHEDEAAARLGKAGIGKGLYLTEAVEGKMLIKALATGLLKVNQEILMNVNEIEDVIFSTCHNYTVVLQDQSVAGTKVIPLVIGKKQVEQAEAICEKQGPIIEVIPLMPLKVGIVVTGSEVYYKRIEDKFGSILQNKVQALGGTVTETLYAPDDKTNIEGCIKTLLRGGAEIIMVSGGMAVDADDVTPSAIRTIADEVITYGSPVLPGAMFMLAYVHNETREQAAIPILGIPACGMYRKITVLDLILPRLFAKEKITKRDILSMAHGGFCYNCEECRYPVCPMGKS